MLSFGRGIVTWWLSPAYLLSFMAERVYFRFMLPNPFLT
jgi:hypothetical protein